MAARICDIPGGEGVGLFLDPVGDGTKPNVLLGIVFGVIMVYCFLGVAIISDIFMNAIETVTAWKMKVVDKESGKGETITIWNETVATLTLMALGSSAPEIFLAVIDNFKKGFHSGDLGPSTIVGSASFNLFVIIAVCCCVIPEGEFRKIENMNAFLVTAFFSVGAYMWMVFALVMRGKDVIDVPEGLITFFALPLLVWISYSIDKGFLSRKCCPKMIDDEESGNPNSICHKVGFETADLDVTGSPEPQELDVKVVRKGGLRTPTQCTYRTERMWGVPSYDFEDVAGTVEFEQGETEVVLKLSIPAKSSNSIGRNFLLVLENAEDNCDFDPEGDGGEECAILTINVSSIDTVRSASKRLDAFVNKNSIRYGFDEWFEQFTSLPYCNGSAEDQAEASAQDWVYHILALPWNIMFAFVPPTSFFGGWLSFIVAIGGIGVVTAFISDVAEMFGCLLDCPDVVTATTFVALGTSMPDLFASLSAAVGDPTADASIVNVTGSNSVNVFLGLGIPWTVASFYWTFLGERTPDWEARYPEAAKVYTTGTVFVVESRNLGFCVLAFSGLACVALVALVLRRKYLGGELGGPKLPKFATGFLFVWLWVAFVTLTSWRVLRCGDGGTDGFCNASFFEQGVVCGAVFAVTVVCIVPFVATTIYFSKDGLALVAGEGVEAREWSEVLDIPAPKSKSAEPGVDPNQEANEPQKDDQLRNTAEKEIVSSMPGFDDLFDVTDVEQEKGMRNKIQFMKLNPGTSSTPAFGSHKVSILPSIHAKAHASVTVIVVAYHNSGRNETVFQTTISKPLRHVMHAWCKAHKLDPEKASFSFHHKTVDPAVNVASLGHDPSKGPLVLRARPVKSDEQSNMKTEAF